VSQPPPALAQQVPRRQAFWFWLRLGFISFGGPAGQIAIMQRELVDERRWISQQRFMHALSYCMLLPGPEAQQLATYLGWLMHRTLGGVVAGVLFILPSLVLLLVLSGLYMLYGQHPLAAGLLYGLKPAVVALVMHALYRLGRRCLEPVHRRPLPWLLALGAFVTLSVFDGPFPAVVLLALALGWAASRWAPNALGHDEPPPRAGVLAPAALIDDHSPSPAHAQPQRRRLLWVLGAGLLLWVLPMLILVGLWGWDATLTQMAAFFTRAALLTFGGAYAVLPYVEQAAVEHHQWLTTAQMMDGLALGETTPGPLIMVVAFVAFVGAWGQQVLGPDALLAGAVLAACVATWFTFLPSFVFILAGGPWVEASRGRPVYALPLRAVTCAVIGVIASLGWTFLQAVIWPAPQAPADVLALGLALLALWLLGVRRWGVLPVLALLALLGAVGVNGPAFLAGL
jgi:chromate transporter